MQTRIEREWKSIFCPDQKENTLIMLEWEILSEGGRILKKRLHQMDCHHPKLTKWGELDCRWRCERILAKYEQ
ncbi:MAG: hypothetical protein HXY44_09970 [Syntrophaceae bacterium]|nr:hypothetical protein [Syntrophaceae bacterium]